DEVVLRVIVRAPVGAGLERVLGLGRALARHPVHAAVGAPAAGRGGIAGADVAAVEVVAVDVAVAVVVGPVGAGRDGVLGATAAVGARAGPGVGRVGAVVASQREKRGGQDERRSKSHTGSTSPRPRSAATDTAYPAILS